MSMGWGFKPMRKWLAIHITLVPLSCQWAYLARLLYYWSSNGSQLNSMHSAFQKYENYPTEERLPGEHYLDLAMF